MSYLFVDSTYDLIVGLLDQKYQWLEWESFKGQKSSLIIQKTIYQQLERNSLSVLDISGVISIMGPGFYTGLRLSEGLIDVFNFFGIKSYSFYSYEIPLWAGINQGTWFTRAYRGEYFLYNWDIVREKSFHELIKKDELSEKMAHLKNNGKPLYIHSEVSLDENAQKFGGPFVHTCDLLKKYPHKIFPHVFFEGENKVEETRKGPFYFRAPEEEFKINAEIKLKKILPAKAMNQSKDNDSSDVSKANKKNKKEREQS